MLRGGPGTPISGWSPDLRAFLLFLSKRTARAGPRAIVCLGMCLFLFASVLMPQRLAIVMFGTHLTPLLRWSEWGVDDGSGGGGLRVVVFGSPDIASFQATSKGQRGKSWTELLCDELSCSSYESLVPRTDTSFPDPVLISNDLYKTVLGTADARGPKASTPRADYAFLLEQHPVPKHPDLVEQMSTFLQRPSPKNAPKETLWVFSFGTWDVWTLSALPRETGEMLVDSMVTHLFSQIELLYQESLSETSRAFSDFWGYADEAVIWKAQRNISFENNRQETEAFRVLIPKVFDLSLTPGWDDLRPSPPPPHSKAEQMRNAAYLAARWNEVVAGYIGAWRRRPKREPRSNPDDMEVGMAEPGSERKRNTERRNWILSEPPEVNPIFAPFPVHTAGLFDVPAFIMEAMTERQMRISNIADSNGIGSRPPNATTYFDEVWWPCSAGDAPASNTQDVAAAMERRGTKAPCRNPDGYLFSTPFSVNQRAIGEIATRAGALARQSLLLGDDIDPHGTYDGPTTERKKMKRGSEGNSAYKVRPRGG